MKHLLLAIVCFVSLAAAAQERTFYGRVTDKDRNGVPFCVVKAKDRNEGVYSDENGKFSITSNMDSVKTFIFFCLGYEKKEVQLTDLSADSAHIELQKSYTSLKTVVIKPKKQKTMMLGKKKQKHYGDCYGKYGDENAMFFKADPRRNAYLKEVRVYVTNEGIPATKFRIHVYEKDSVTNMPSTELTDSNLIVNAKRGNEWVKANLSRKNIPVHSGVYVSVEWISGHGNDNSALQSVKHTAVSDHNGQVVGLTLNYGITYMYYKNSFKGIWENKYKDKEYLCPMINATCTYSKK